MTERMRAMSLSRRLQRASGVTRNLMNRLIEVDLVVQRDGTFDLRDPVFTVWLASFHAGVELLTLPRQEILAQLVADMSERFQRVSSELWLARESQVLGRLWTAGRLTEWQEARLAELDRRLLEQAARMEQCYGLGLRDLLAIFRWGTPLTNTTQPVRLEVDPASLDRMATVLTPASRP